MKAGMQRLGVAGMSWLGVSSQQGARAHRVTPASSLILGRARRKYILPRCLDQGERHLLISYVHVEAVKVNSVSIRQILVENGWLRRAPPEGRTQEEDAHAERQLVLPTITTPADARQTHYLAMDK